MLENLHKLNFDLWAITVHKQ